MTFQTDLHSALANAEQTILASHNDEVSRLQGQVDALGKELAVTQAALDDCLAGQGATGTGFIIGTSVPGANVAERQAAVNKAKSKGMNGIRVYYGGTLPADPKTDTWTSLAAEGETWVVSYKTAASQAVLDGYISKWKAFTKARLVLCWHHEPENDTASLTPAAFRTTSTQQADRVRTAGAEYAIILMAYSLNPASNRNWQDWWIGSNHADWLMFDAYNVGDKKGIYTDPAKISNPCKAAAATAGVKWGIAETGAWNLGTVNGQTRDQWAAALVDSVQADEGMLLLWWNQSTAGGDFTLADSTYDALVTAAGH